MQAYYDLLERLENDENVANCIYYLRKLREPDIRIDKLRIKEDLAITRGLNKYEFEINLMVKMTEDKLQTVLASSLDFTNIDMTAREYKKLLKAEAMPDKEAERQSQIAERISRAFQDIANKLKRTGKIVKRKQTKKKTIIIKQRKQPTLFEEI